MVHGKGSPDVLLTESEIEDVCREAFAAKHLDGKKVLFILPDHSRSAPIDVMFRIVYKLLADRVELLDFLIALGTHPPMTDEMINNRVGITQEERSTRYARARFFNHGWDDPDQLVTIGTIS